MRTVTIVAILALVVGLAGTLAGATTITIINQDGPGEGFNDPTPVAPVGGNTGATLGAQRLIAFQAAADYWASLIESSVEIRVNAQFNPLVCDAGGAVLGSCGATTIYRNFPNAPQTNVWFSAALADAIAGVDQTPGTADMQAQFNSNLDGGVGCTLTWWYGVDDSYPSAAPGNMQNFFVVLTHEMGHGLGFQNFINEANGQLQGGYPDIYSTFTLDVTSGLHWDEMNDAQRVASAINTNQVVLDGPNNKAASDDYMRASEVDLQIATGPATGTYVGAGALFGAGWADLEGTAGTMELANDGTGTTFDGCEPLTGFTPGNIAYITRGICEFGLKALHAEQAGASAAVIANNQGATALVYMGGGIDGGQVTIPVMAITQNDGAIVQPALPVAGTWDLVSVWGIHPANGMTLLYAPNPVELGSSISHYDVSAWPNALMEPNINPDLTGWPDMTLGMFRDIGWTLAADMTIFEDGFESGGTTNWSGTQP